MSDRSPPASVSRAARISLGRTVVVLGFTSFFTDVGSEMIFPLLPVFVATLGAGPRFLGLVEGFADATSSLLKLAAGYLSDRMPRKKPLVFAGYGLAAIVRPLVALAQAPWHVLAVRVTDRVGKGIRGAPRDVLIAATAPQGHEGRAFGFQRAMDHAGACVGPLVASALLALGVPMRTVFWVAVVPGLLSLGCIALVREPGSVSPTKPLPAPEAPAIRAPLPRRLVTFLVIVALFSLGNSSDAFLLLRAKELGVTTTALPILWTVFHVSKVASSVWGGAWSDRMGRSFVICSGWAVYAVTYAAFGFATSRWQMWALFVVYGAYHGLTEPAEKALLRDLTPAEVRGRAYGYYNFVIGGAAVPAGLLTGWLWETRGALAALGVGAALALAATIALIGWSRTMPPGMSNQGQLG